MRDFKVQCVTWKDKVPISIVAPLALLPTMPTAKVNTENGNYL